MSQFNIHIRLHAFLFILAVPINLIWEVAQIGAYDFPDGSLMRNVLGCFVPSLGDGLMILIIYWAGWLVFRDSQWILEPRLKGFLLMAAMGLTLAVLVEWNALFRTGAWAYNKEMVAIPILGVGLLPVLQMLFLPPLIAVLVQATWRHRKKTPGVHP